MPAKSTRTPKGDAKFFGALEDGHSVHAACAAALYARSCVYRWRMEDAAFAARWAKATVIAGDLLEEEADRRGRDGYDEGVFFGGQKIDTKRKYSDALLLARLKAVRPQHYRERISMPGAGGQKVTVVIRDYHAEETMLRLLAENKITVDELPPRMQARLAARRED